MRYDPQKHQRKSIRLKGYNYSRPGWYFTTIVTQNREMLFAEAVDEKMVLNNARRIAEQCWRAIQKHYPNVQLNEYVNMPNHVHGIIGMMDDKKRCKSKKFSPLQHPSTHFRSPSKTIGSVMRGFKIGVIKWFRQNTEIYPLWQRNYWDRIIRS